jgi:hypothetical protein
MSVKRLLRRYSNPIPSFATSKRVATLTAADTIRMAMAKANSLRSISSSGVGVPRIQATAEAVDREVSLQLRLNSRQFAQGGPASAVIDLAPRRQTRILLNIHPEC